MAATSTMLELGTPLPAFSLPDTRTNDLVSSRDLAGSIAGVAILCNHCPYVKHIRSELAAFGRDCDAKGVRLAGISANDPASHPEDGPAAMAAEARAAGYTFPYLFDETQDVAKAFRAACTPEFYVFDREGRLFYRGRFDETNPRNGQRPTGRDVRAAVDAALAGSPPPTEQTPSIGCSIKWKAGNEPDYVR